MDNNNYNSTDKRERKFNPDKAKKYDKFKNKKFPFNFRNFVPEIPFDTINDADNIRVISYNILCDSLVSISTQIQESDLINYPYMTWDSRRKEILSELNELNGDIICLQELERDEVLIEAMSKSGYDCTIKPRTGNHSEGCAIFWKNSKFKVINIYSLEFNMNLTPQNISEVYDRDNICLFTVLQYLAYPEMCFIVTNTHLLFNNNRGDIKLGQVYQLINSLNLLKNYYIQQYTKVNLIFCGDLNSVPNSGVYKMITEGKVDCSKLDRRKISGQNQGSLQNVQSHNLKSTLLKYVTSKYNESINQNNSGFENEGWFNSILCVESQLDPETQIISLKYKDKYKFETGTLILTPELTFASAYSEVLRKTLNFMKDSEGMKLTPPFDKITDSKILDDSEVYGIKMGFADIDRTLSFTKNFTLEPPYSFYGKGMMALVDYIFYSGGITPVRTLNIPDINKVAFDIGYLPNEHFPSDHISLCVDFQILK